MVLIASFTLTAPASSPSPRSPPGAASKLARMANSFFYPTGLAEGADTIAAFTAMCLWPARFPAIAYLFAALCLLTVIQRSLLARRTFGP